MTDASTGTGQGVGDVGPWIDTPAPACLDHAERRGVGGATFLRPCSKTEAPGDDSDAQSALGLVVGRRQEGVGDERHDRRPIVQDFPRELADFLGFMLAVE